MASPSPSPLPALPQHRPTGHASSHGHASSQARSRPALLLLSAALLLAGCGRQPSAESQRIDELEFKLQQLEERLNKAASAAPDPADRAGKPPAGPVKSLTLRTGTDDDRLRIYWADGSKSDLPCTKEQATLVCG